MKKFTKNVKNQIRNLFKKTQDFYEINLKQGINLKNFGKP